MANWRWPQFVYVILTLVSLKNSLAVHDEYEIKKVLVCSILLYFGGFFK